MILETMAKEEQNKAPEENLPDQFSDRDIFSDEVYKELRESDIIAGGENLYDLLKDFSATDDKFQIENKSKIKSKPDKKFSLIQKVLIFCIVMVASILVYMLLEPVFNPVEVPPLSEAVIQTAAPEMTDKSTPVSDTGQSDIQQVSEPGSTFSSNQSLSLSVARNFYEQEDFVQAFSVYQQMRENLPNVGEEELLRDFLQLKMALCANRKADYEQANHLLSLVCESRSPAVKVIANYHLTLLEIRKKQYLRARTRAYKTIALIKAVDFDDDWALSFECDCYFLAAECLTRHILSLGNADNNFPENLWGNLAVLEDPFEKLNESQLRRFLNSGADILANGLLEPEIRKIEQPDGLPRWSVVSYGIPVEELLTKIAGAADFNINWAVEPQSAAGQENSQIRQRPVSLYLPAASYGQIVQIIAGCAGLLASTENEHDKPGVTIFDPTNYSSLQEHIYFLCRHAVSLWQEFALTFYSDKRLGNCHFAMGLLQSLMELPAEAIAEYKLVANRFSQSPLAPFALLHSSKLKSNLRDYRGAREDLKQLIEQYPDTKVFGQSYLCLADATMEAGLKSEAAQLYQRIYNFDLSVDSNIASALGAAGCYYETESYQDAVKWLIRYIELAGDDKNNDLYSAYLLLGKSYLALEQYQRACDAFKYALTEQNSREQYVEAIQSLVESHIEQGNFLEALDVLESVRTIALSQEQSIDMLVLKSRVYRLLALVDTAVVLLRDRSGFVTEPALKAKISFELAMCYITKGDLELARSSLGDVLSYVESGPFSHKAALELADVCLKLDQNSQAITICSQLLDSNTSDQTKRRALELLASAYNQQGNYEKAALALSGQWK